MTKMSWRARFVGWIDITTAIILWKRRLCRCRRGAILAVTAGGIFAFMGVIALAVDMSNYQHIRSRLASATDAAALGSAAIPLEHFNGSRRVRSQWQDTCRRFFDANIVGIDGVKTIECKRLFSADGKDDEITVESKITTPTLLANIIGINNLEARWRSVAMTSQSMEIAMVVDISSSMDRCLCPQFPCTGAAAQTQGQACARIGGTRSRLEAVKKSLTTLTGRLFNARLTHHRAAASRGPGYRRNAEAVRVSIIPFDSGTSIGSMQGRNYPLRQIVNRKTWSPNQQWNRIWRLSQCMRSRKRILTTTPNTNRYHCGALKVRATSHDMGFLDKATCPETKELDFLRALDINDLTPATGLFDPTEGVQDDLFFDPMAYDADEIDTFGSDSNVDTQAVQLSRACWRDNLSITPLTWRQSDIEKAIYDLEVRDTTLVGSNLTSAVAWGMRAISPNWGRYWPDDRGRARTPPVETLSWREGVFYSAGDAITNFSDARKIIIIVSDGIQEIVQSDYGTGDVVPDIEGGNHGCTLATSQRNVPFILDAGLSSQNAGRRNYINEKNYGNTIHCWSQAVRELNYRLYRELCPALKRRNVAIYFFALKPALSGISGGNTTASIRALQAPMKECASGENETQKRNYFRSIGTPQELESAVGQFFSTPSNVQIKESTEW